MTPTGESVIETQKNLEELFHKHQLIPVLRDQFAELTDDPFKLDVIVQMYLHKQATVPTLVGLFSPKWGTPQEVANMLTECVEEDLVDYDLDSDRFVLKYEVTQDVQDILDRYQFPLPMIVPPIKLTDNRMGSGYYDRKGRVVLNGSDIFDEEDICLDHLNRCNQVALTLNLNVMASPEGHVLKPVRKIGESFEDFRKRTKQMETFYNTSMDVMEGMLTLGNQFWLTHKYDRRGRTYAVGYHINSQGTDYNKAVLELAKKETLSGIDAIMALTEINMEEENHDESQ